MRGSNTYSCGKYPSQKQSINIMTHKQGHYGLICCCYAYGIITFFLKICNNFVVVIVIIARLRMLLCGWVKNSEIIHYFLVKSSVCLVVCQFHLSHTQTLSVSRHEHSFFFLGKICIYLILSSNYCFSTKAYQLHLSFGHVSFILNKKIQ